MKARHYRLVVFSVERTDMGMVMTGLGSRPAIGSDMGLTRHGIVPFHSRIGADVGGCPDKNVRNLGGWQRRDE